MSSTSKRRRFQPPITTFFAPLDHNASSPISVSGPAQNELPHQIQSSLLTVGMRIRKSIPEGYKTISKTPLGAYTSYNNSTTPTDAITTYRSFAGLAPFCGILKTGNLAVQSMPEMFQQPTGFAMAVDDTPNSLPSSQESNTSASSRIAIAQNSNKRSLGTYSDEEEDEDDEDGAILSHILSRNRRNAYPVSHTRYPDLSTLTSSTSLLSRAMAVPKSRRKKFVWQGMEGQENVPRGSTPGFEFDFGEADFLRGRREVDEDMEMDVS